MKDNRLGGIALIIGAVSGIITMAIHPVTGGHPITPAQFETLAAVLIGVHVLAIAGIPFLFLGGLALTRLLDSPSRVAVTALAIYSLSLVAVMIVKTRALSRAIGVYGLLLGCATVIAMAFGLKMDAHGFGLVIFGEGTWLVIVGSLLLRAKEGNKAKSDLK